MTGLRAGQVDLAPCRADRRRWPRSRVRIRSTWTRTTRARRSRRSRTSARSSSGATRRAADPRLRAAQRAGAAPGPIDVGNAGTLMRAAARLARRSAGDASRSTATLDPPAPVGRIAEPLAQMGASIDAREDGFPPLTVHGAPLPGIDYELPVAERTGQSSSAARGAVDGGDHVIEPGPSRDHPSGCWLPPGADRSDRRGHGGRVRSDGRNVASSSMRPIVDRARASAASILPVAAAHARAATRRQVLGPASRQREPCGSSHPRADGRRSCSPTSSAGHGHRASRSRHRCATAVDGDHVRPRRCLSDRALTLAALAAASPTGDDGRARRRLHLRVKESDRIATSPRAVAPGRAREATEDGFTIDRRAGCGRRRFDTYDDHRMAMLAHRRPARRGNGVEVDRDGGPRRSRTRGFAEV